MPVHAQETANLEAPLVVSTVITEDPESYPISRFDQFVVQAEGMHDYVSEGIEFTAKSIDLFFAEDKAFDEATYTYLRLGLDSVWHEHEGLGFAGELRMKLDLPNTRKRLKLLIETDAQRGETEVLEEKPADVAQNRDYSIALERASSRLKKWNLRPSLGIRLHTPIDFFIRLRTHRYYNLERWLLHVSSGVRWYDSRGFDAYFNLSHDYPLSDNWLFRYAPGMSWKEEDMYRTIGQELSLFQQIDEKQKMAYQILAGANDESDDWRAVQYDILIRYRRNLYKKWLFGEVIPQWTFEKESGFHPRPALTFRLEVVFGERYRDD